jgi:hypothetical protein
MNAQFFDAAQDKKLKEVKFVNDIYNKILAKYNYTVFRGVAANTGFYCKLIPGDVICDMSSQVQHQG